MSEEVDLKRFNQVFFEECAENLAEMEQILLGLKDREPDPEQLNAIFRAAHSIKGGAGIFGFQDMTVVTHVLESLLDRIRSREIPFRPDYVDLFLKAGDAIAHQLAGHRDGAPVDRELVERVSAELGRLIEPGDRAAATEPAPAAPPTGPRRLELVFTPDPDIFLRGVRVDGLIDELAELGELSVSAELIEIPKWDQLDPEQCLTRWCFRLTTAATRDQILEIFMFVADEAQLAIRELDLPPQPLDLSPGPEPEPRPDAGRRLYDRDESASGGFGRRQGENDASIRVNVTKVDQLINQVGELLITQAMLVQNAAGLDPILHEALHRSVAQLERNSRDLQQSVMSIRLVPISLVFSRFPRMVRELAAKIGKQVELTFTGGSTELDKGLIEKVADPLSHLVRNALDHGLESPEVRSAAGKPATGSLELKASQVGGKIVIEVIDDGAGLNRERILLKAAQRGLIVSPEMTDDEVWQLVFAPGFSTAEAVTDLSGRGVGMDVVLKNVQSLGGRVQIASAAGVGTRISITLPLTLAILEGLSVAVADEKFIVPLNAVLESLQPQKEQLKTVKGREVVQVRGEYIPIVPLNRLFAIEGAVSDPSRGILVLVELEGEKGALLVDLLLDEHQVVVKSIETNFRKVPGTAGATILGDGRVALILEVTELMALHKKGPALPV